MPTYAFRCDACQHEFTVNVPYARKKESRCPQCDGDNLTELFGRYTLNVMGGSGGRSNSGNADAGPACSPFGGG